MDIALDIAQIILNLIIIVLMVRMGRKERRGKQDV